MVDQGVKVRLHLVMFSLAISAICVENHPTGSIVDLFCHSALGYWVLDYGCELVHYSEQSSFGLHEMRFPATALLHCLLLTLMCGVTLLPELHHVKRGCKWLGIPAS